MNILDKELYERVKKRADKIYKKPSAYKSGFIVQEYKREGGRYSGAGFKREANSGFKREANSGFKRETGLSRWFNEKWTSVSAPNQYPVYRPTIRVNKSTPLTVSEIDPQNLKEQIKLKQKIRGEKNLPPFVGNL